MVLAISEKILLRFAIKNHKKDETRFFQKKFRS